MGTTHTPGPWRGSNEIRAEDGMIIAEVFAMEDCRDDGKYSHACEAEANARLIAAAPELLAALMTLVESLRWEVRRSGTTYNGFEGAVAAIGKAIARGNE